MAKNKYINSLIRLLNINGEKQETTPLRLFDQTIQNPHTLDTLNHQILITIPDGLTVVSQVRNENGDVTTTFSDGTVIFVPKVNIPKIYRYQFDSSDDSIDISYNWSSDDAYDYYNYDLKGLSVSTETDEDGTTITFNDGTIINIPPPQEIPDGLSIISQLNYGAGILTTFSDGHSIYVPNPINYTFWSPDNSIIINNDNNIISFQVAASTTITDAEHLTSVVETTTAIGEEVTTITDLTYTQRAGQDDGDAKMQPIADMELAIYGDESFSVALEPDNPNSYADMFHQDATNSGYFIKARLYGDILTNLPTNWNINVTGTGNIISPSHWLIHRWMGRVVPPEPLIVTGSIPEDTSSDLEWQQDFTFYFNTEDLHFVQNSNDWILELRKTGDTSMSVWNREQFTIVDNSIRVTGWIGENNSEYTLTLLAGMVKRSNGQVNDKYEIKFRTKYVKPIEYTLDGNYNSGLSNTSPTSVIIRDYTTQEIVTTIAPNNWDAVEQYLPNVIECINGGFNNWETSSPSYDIVLPKCISIGDGFLWGARSFNANISAPVCKHLGSYFFGFIGGRGEIVPFDHDLDFPVIEDIEDDFFNQKSVWNKPLQLPTLTTIGNNFLQGCTSFNQSLDISQVTTIGNNFLSGCSLFNQSLDVSQVTTIGSNFLSGCSSFNQSLDISQVTTIGSNFLYGCSSFNQSLDISQVTTIGSNFLYSCSSFNQVLDVYATTIGNYFLSTYNTNAPMVFDSDVIFRNLETATNINFFYSLSSLKTAKISFLKLKTTAFWFNGNTNFEGNVELPVLETINVQFRFNSTPAWTHGINLPKVTLIPDYFFYNLKLMNGEVLLPSVTTMGSNFLSGCTNFNQSLDISQVTTIGNNFLSGCTNFNQSLDISQVTTMGSNFLQGCTSFNQSLDISQVTTIGSNFLYGCSLFNQSLDISQVTTIGAYFLYGCTSFNQVLDVYATTIGNYFLYCKNFRSTLTIKEFIMTSTISSFFSGIPYGVFDVYVIFEQPQTTTSLNSNNFGSNSRYTINLTLPSSSVGIDVTNKKWYNIYFKSITLT